MFCTLCQSTQWRVIKRTEQRDRGYDPPKGRKCGICTMNCLNTWILPEGAFLWMFIKNDYYGALFKISHRRINLSGAADSKQSSWLLISALISTWVNRNHAWATQHMCFALWFRQTERCCACRKTKPQSTTNPLLVCVSVLAGCVCVCMWVSVCVSVFALGASHIVTSTLPLMSRDRKKHVLPTPQGVSTDWVGGWVLVAWRLTSIKLLIGASPTQALSNLPS